MVGMGEGVEMFTECEYFCMAPYVCHGFLTHIMANYCLQLAYTSLFPYNEMLSPWLNSL